MKTATITTTLPIVCMNNEKSFPRFMYEGKKVTGIFFTFRAGSCMHCTMSVSADLASLALRASQTKQESLSVAKAMKGNCCPKSNQFFPSCVHLLGSQLEALIETINHKEDITEEDIEKISSAK